MANERIVEWVLQTVGGLFLLVIGALLTAMRKEVSALWKEHGTLRTNHDNLRTDHAALSARVAAERDDTLRTMSRVESSLENINRKLDELADSLRHKN